MEDFGTLLPFQYVNEPDSNCYRAHYFQLHAAKSVEEHGELVHYPEQWAYFVWLPESCGPMQLAQPDGWGIVPEIPHEYLFVEIRREPVYFLPWWEDDAKLPLLDFLSAHGECPQWLQREIEIRRSSSHFLPRSTNFEFERFARKLLHA
jgi:hypothetical protein